MTQSFISFIGLFVLIGMAWLVSEDRKRFPVRVVVWGLVLQLSLGFLVLKWEPGERFFSRLNDVVNALLAFTTEGAKFVFASFGSVGPGSLQDYLIRVGKPSTDPAVQQAISFGIVPGFSFAFQVLPTIIFFSALLSILYYLGIMQKVVMLFAKVMAKTMNVSGAESLSNSANIFVGQTEAPLVVAPYIEKMTRSELMAIMVGGFSNTAGGVLGAYVLMLQGYFPKIAGHLITASLLSAPAAFIIAKVMVPEKEEPLTRGDDEDARGGPGREHPRRGLHRHHRGLESRHQRGRHAHLVRGHRGPPQLLLRLVRRLLPRHRRHRSVRPDAPRRARRPRLHGPREADLRGQRMVGSRRGAPGLRGREVVPRTRRRERPSASSACSPGSRCSCAPARIAATARRATWRSV